MFLSFLSGFLFEGGGGLFVGFVVGRMGLFFCWVAKIFLDGGGTGYELDVMMNLVIRAMSIGR